MIIPDDAQKFIHGAHYKLSRNKVFIFLNNQWRRSNKSKCEFLSFNVTVIPEEMPTDRIDAL